MNKRKYIEELFDSSFMNFAGESAEEIRIRINKPATIIYKDNEFITNEIFDRSKIERLVEKMTKSSVYTFTKDIADGFITISGGHRVGIAGTAVYEDGKIKNIKDISALNIRIAKELKGVGEGVFSEIKRGNKIKNLLVISPPGGGKTTLLRDLTRLISDNTPKCRVVVIDERNEISATFMGEPQNDVGKRTDVLCGYGKYDGVIRAIRSMSPDVVVLDELGGERDTDAVMKLRYSGVKVIASLHGETCEDVKKSIPYLIEKNVFDCFLFLDRENSRMITAGEFGC